MPATGFARPACTSHGAAARAGCRRAWRRILTRRAEEAGPRASTTGASAGSSSRSDTDPTAPSPGSRAGGSGFTSSSSPLALPGPALAAGSRPNETRSLLCCLAPALRRSRSTAPGPARPLTLSVRLTDWPTAAAPCPAPPRHRARAGPVLAVRVAPRGRPRARARRPPPRSRPVPHWGEQAGSRCEYSSLSAAGRCNPIRTLGGCLGLHSSRHDRPVLRLVFRDQGVRRAGPESAKRECPGPVGRRRHGLAAGLPADGEPHPGIRHGLASIIEDPARDPATVGRGDDRLGVLCPDRGIGRPGANRQGPVPHRGHGLHAVAGVGPEPPGL